jgi:uncharacterized protein YciI
MLFCVIRHDKPEKLDLRLSERSRHLEYLKIVLEKIIYGGALRDTEGKQIGSMLIIDVVDEAAAEAFAADDPYSDTDLFKETIIQSFKPVFIDGSWL